MPNRYYIVVPEKLVSLAVEGLKGTPYGVIASDGCRGAHSAYYSKSQDRWYSRDYDYLKLPEDRVWMTSPCGIVPGSCTEEVTVKKPAHAIHGDHINPDIMVAITRRTTRENIILMEEVRLLNLRLRKEKNNGKPSQR